MRPYKPLTMIGIGGAVLALGITTAVGTAMAQTPTAAPTQPPAQTSKPTPSAAKTNYGNFFIDRLAADLGTTTDKLKSALTQARNETVDQAVKDGKLTQQQADKIKSNTNVGPGFGFGFGFHGHPGRGEMGRGFIGGPKTRDAIAKALGITTQSLNTQLQTKTLAQVAQGKEQAVKDAIVNTIKPQLDQAVKDGKMTQAQENQRISNIQNMDLSKIGGPQAHQWKGHGRPGTQPQAAE